MPPPALRACLAPWGATTRRLSGAAASASNPEAGAGSPTGGTQEQPADAEGPLAQGRRMVVKAPAPGRALDNPAATDAPLPLLQRASQAAQDLLLRPLPETRGRAYHYAEDSARAALAEQQAQGQGLPGDESMYAPAEEVGDAITAPRNWHFSNRTEEEAPERGKDASSDGKNPGEKA